MTIYFYSTKDDYGYFSNFSAHPIVIDGKEWLTSEHYFQSCKFDDVNYREKIHNAKTPMKAAQLGRSRKHPLIPNWEQIKDDVMRKAVLTKFQTHNDLKEKLLSTKNEQIIEQTTTDYYWGCGSDGTGKNILGDILMETREVLRKG